MPLHSRSFLVALAACLTLVAASASAIPRAIYKDSFGSAGTGTGQLAGPDGIAISDDGFVYVADTYNNRVQKFTLTGQHVLTFGGGLVQPYGIDVDSDGNVYVGALGNHSVTKFSANGTFLLSFDNTLLVSPFGLWVEDGGSVYVTDRPAHCIRKYSRNGVLEGTIGPVVGPETMALPQNVEGDDHGLLYVSNGSPAYRVIVLTTAGAFVRSIPSPPGIYAGNPTGGDFLIGRFYLSQYNLNRVVGLDANGQVVDQIGDDEPVTFNSPLDLATIGDSLLLVLDTGNGRVHRFGLAEQGNPPTVQVIEPNGGETLAIGVPASLRWNAADDGAIANVDLLLSRDGGATFGMLAAGVPNTGTYAWTVTGPPSPHCRMRVDVRDNDGLTAQDGSDASWSITTNDTGPRAEFLSSFGSTGNGPGDFSGPNGIATSDDGFIYVADTYNSRVQKFTAAGVFVQAFGSNGTGPGQFSRPYGIDVDPIGNVYVGDLDQPRIQKFGPAGQHLTTFGAGDLTQAFGLWVSDDGVVFVTDRPANRVMRFSTSGATLGPLVGDVGDPSLISPQNIEGDGQGQLYISNGDGKLRMHIRGTSGAFVRVMDYPSGGNPTGGAFAQGVLFLSEYNLDRVLAIAPEGDDILFTLSEGGGLSMSVPFDCATLGDTLLLVLETGRGRVLRYALRDVSGPRVPPTVEVLAPNGGEAFLIGAPTTLEWNAVDDGSVVGVDLLLSRDGGITFEALATGVANTGSYPWTVTAPASPLCRLKVRAHDDDNLTAQDISDGAWSILSTTSPPAAAFLGQFGSPGSGPGQLGGPDGIATSDDGFVYVADTYNSRVQKFTLSGALVTAFGSNGTGPGQFSRPYGIDVDADGNVYVGDFELTRIQKFNSAGQHLLTFGTADLTQPFGLWVSDEGIVYVTDRPANRIMRYSTDGTPLGPLPSASGHPLSYPQNVEGDGQGLLYVSNGEGKFGVHIRGTSGSFVREMNFPSSGNPTGAALARGVLFLSEYNLNHVLGIDADTDEEFLALIEGDGTPMNSPIDCATSGDSLLLVLDTGNGRVLRYRILGGGVPVLHVDAPNGGEALRIGSADTLRWAATTEGIASVDLALSRDGGTTYSPLATGLANSGAYAWTVTGPPSSQCRLRVTTHGPGGAEATDASDQDWSICLDVALDVRPHLVILKDFPWRRWVAAYVNPPDPHAAADIDVSSLRLNGLPPLASPAPKIIWSGQLLRVMFDRHDFLQTLVPGSHVPVNLTGAIGSTCIAGVDYLRVFGPVVHRPRAGDQVLAGSVTDITWDADPEAQTVTILSSLDGETWNVEAQGTPNTGSYLWTVPAVASDAARVQVISIYEDDADGFVHEAEYALSDSFSIVSPTAVGDGPITFALSPISPNPVTGRALRVSFSLPNATPATLELIDVAGRRVAAQEVGTRGIGRHVVDLADGRNLAAGLYVVRLRQDGRSAASRVILMP